MISSHLKESIPTLELMSNIKSKKLREQFLLDQYKVSDKIYKAIREIAENLIHKNIPLETHHKKKLQRYKKDIVNIVHDKAKTRRKSHIKQSGGYLPIILPVVLSLIQSMING